MVCKSNNKTPSLNECLEIRALPQAVIFDIGFRYRIKKYLGLDRFSMLHATLEKYLDQNKKLSRNN